MGRRLLIASVVEGILIVVLGVALASVGTQFDETRIELRALTFEIDSLQEDVEMLADERAALQGKVEEQLGTIEQLKVQLDRAQQGGQAGP